MNNQIQAFESAQFGTVRALSVGGEPQLVAADVARALGYRKASDMLRSLDADEKVLNTPEENGSSDGAHTVRPLADQQFYTITEAGFYRIVLQRKTACIGDDATRANVEAFQRWVTHDVLPALRRHGVYATPEALEALLGDPEFAIRTFTALRDERERRRELEAESAAQRERIARLGDENARLLPMATYAETTLDAVGCITLTDAARQLKQQDPTVGQRRLFGLLRADGMLCKSTNQATAQAIERGYLRNVQKFYTESEGVQRMSEPYAVVTPKGLAWMVSRYCRQASIA